MKTVYISGVFDMFHQGHLNILKQAQACGDKLIVGVVGDDDAIRYKRSPVIPETHRRNIVANIRGVDQVICPCPMTLQREFIDEHRINLVVHGFANSQDASDQEPYFKVPRQMGIFKQLKYQAGVSTTEIINKINKIKKL